MNNLIEQHDNRNGSTTIKGLHDGTGAERQLNVHGYRIASSHEPKLAIAILDREGKFLASVILNESTIRPVIDQILNMI